MTWLFLTLFLGCGAPEPAPPVEPAPKTAPVPALTGQVLYASQTHLVVNHTETVDRVTPGAAVYAVPIPDLTEGLAAGDQIALKTREKKGVLQVKQVRKTGAADLPPASGKASPITGTVVNTEAGRITLDHEPVEGVMGAMVMSFLTDQGTVEAVSPGDVVQGTIVSSPTGFVLVDAAVAGTGNAALREDIAPLRTGEVFPRTEVPVEDGSTIIVGEGQPQRTALTFLYTTCPDPAFCPALAARLQALQHELAGEARIVAITIDPEVDQLHVLERYAKGVSANPATWRFGRLEPEWLQRVALLSGMAVTIENGRIAHLMRMLILDRDGTVIERYDDNDWPLERVALQLRTGEPRKPAGELGTRYDR